MIKYMIKHAFFVSSVIADTIPEWKVILETKCVNSSNLIHSENRRTLGVRFLPGSQISNDLQYVEWQNKIHRIVDMWHSQGQQHSIHIDRFKCGKLFIRNICFVEKYYLWSGFIFFWNERWTHLRMKQYQASNITNSSISFQGKKRWQVN